MLFIKNAQINTITSGILENGQILVEEDKIVAIGTELKCPAGAKVVDAKGYPVYPGFIDPHTHLGMWEDGIGVEGADGNEETDPITPNLRAIDGINPMERSFEEAIEGGVTCVATGPGSANVIGGQYAAIKTHGKRVDNMIVKAPIGMKIAFGENPKSVYGKEDKMPQTRMAIAALLRETLKDASEYLESIRAYEDDEDGDKPEYDMKMDALIPVLKGEIPLKAHAHRADDIFTAIRIAKEFDVKLTLDHCTEGHLIVDELVEEGYHTIVGPSLTDRSKVELRNQSFKTPGILSERGVHVSLTTDHPVIPLKYFHICAAMAVKEGMSVENALKAITINPAITLGIEDRVGSIEIGKDADLVIWSGDPLNIMNKPLGVFVEGKEVLIDKSLIED